MAKKRKAKCKCTKKKSARKKPAKKKKRSKGLWKSAEIALLRKLFPNNPTAKIARQFGRKVDAVKKKASRMGIKKSKKYLRSISRA